MWVSASGAESWGCPVTGLLAACRVEGHNIQKHRWAPAQARASGSWTKLGQGGSTDPLLHHPDMNVPKNGCTWNSVSVKRTVILRRQYLLGGLHESAQQ